VSVSELEEKGGDDREGGRGSRLSYELRLRAGELLAGPRAAPRRLRAGVDVGGVVVGWW
jgi:hypothetical protein